MINLTAEELQLAADQQIALTNEVDIKALEYIARQDIGEGTGDILLMGESWRIIVRETTVTIECIALTHAEALNTQFVHDLFDSLNEDKAPAWKTEWVFWGELIEKAILGRNG